MADEEKTQSEETEKQAKSQKQEKKTRKILTMAQGKSTTSKRGILKHGDELRPEYFAAGQAKIDRMKKSGSAVEIEVPV